MSIEADVVEHYRAEELLAAIEAGVGALGRSPDTVTVDDLGPVDEFHIGGRPATIELCDQLGIDAGSDVLDVGCGIGGTARLVASTYGCRVTGVDLVPGYVDVARQLAAWTGLDGRVDYHVGSALDLPIESASFDVATQIHVGMNIEDKAACFDEVRRVLRAGATFGIYDVMRTGPGELGFPVPWATEASTSFVAPIADYEAALGSAGFEVVAVRERGRFALEFFEAMQQRTAELGGPPPLGLHVIIGSATPDKIANMLAALSQGIVAPVEVIARAV